MYTRWQEYSYRLCTRECELGTEIDTDDMEKEGTDHDAFSFIPTKYFIQSI